jgi:hypothetical protein
MRARARPKPPASRSSRGVAAPRQAKVERWAKRADVVLVPQLVRRTVRGDAIPCAGRLQQGTGTMEKFTLSTWSPSPGMLRVTVISYGLSTAGVGPAFLLTKTATGYSFSGNTCMFTWGEQCPDGKALQMIISISGKIATAPGTIEYTYTSELFCGGVLSCVENGKFAGTRWGGAAPSAEGTWYGNQTWTVQCCGARYALPRGGSPTA